MRNVSGNHLRVLSHECKTADYGKAEENEARDLEKQKVKDPRDSSDECSGTAQETMRDPPSLRASENPNGGSKTGSCRLNRAARVSYSFCHDVILTMTSRKAPAPTINHDSLFRGMPRRFCNIPGL